MNFKEAYKFVTEKQIPGCQSYIDKHRGLQMRDKAEEWKRIEAEGPKVGQLWVSNNCKTVIYLKSMSSRNNFLVELRSTLDSLLKPNIMANMHDLFISTYYSLFDLGDSLNTNTQSSKVDPEVKPNIVNPIHNPDVPEDLEELHRRHLAFMRGSL